jgi:hypothetical protein
MIDKEGGVYMGVFLLKLVGRGVSGSVVIMMIRDCCRL